MTINRYVLTEEVEQKYTPIIQEFIDKIEALDPDTEEVQVVIDLSGTELNPYTLQALLEKLGYKQEDVDTNGWQMDFWITMTKSECKDILIEGTGITFELKLAEKV